jgi:hypothetical protein
MAGADQAIRAFVAQAVIDAVGFVQAGSDDIDILRVVAAVTPKDSIGEMVGQLDQP